MNFRREHGYPALPLRRSGEAREGISRLFPATEGLTYCNTAAVGPASRRLLRRYERCLERWGDGGFDWLDGEAAGEHARAAVARNIGAAATDLRLAVHLYNHEDDIERVTQALAACS